MNKVNMLVNIFIDLKNYWFTTQTNTMHGRIDVIKKFLYTYDPELNQCGEDYDDHNLIHAESKFKEFYESIYPRTEIIKNQYAYSDEGLFSYYECSSCKAQEITKTHKYCPICGTKLIWRL